MIIDGNSLINRAYYAFGAGGGLTWNGMPTNATYGFLNMMFNGIKSTGVTHVAIAFDVRAKTFRHKQYAEYKATRKGMPDELAAQLDDLKNLLQVMNIKTLEAPGFEADDIIGTLACQVNGGVVAPACLADTEGTRLVCGTRKSGEIDEQSVARTVLDFASVPSVPAKHAGATSVPPKQSDAMPVIILTADRDAFQLIRPGVELHLTKTGTTNTDIWTHERVAEEYRINPAQFIELKALMGDKSDNIPGAAGVGEKTALALIQEFGTVAEVYRRLGEVKETTRAKLGPCEDAVLMSRDLVTINTSVPLEYTTEDFKYNFPFGRGVYDAFMARGFKSLCKRRELWSEDYFAGEGGEADVKPIAEIKIIEIKTKEELEKVVGEILENGAVVGGPVADGGVAGGGVNGGAGVPDGGSGGAAGIALHYDDRAFYLAGAGVEYHIIVFADMLVGGILYDDILRTMRPLFESPIAKHVYDSKSFKEYLARHGMALNAVTIDARICDHLLSTRTRAVTPKEFLELYRVTQGQAVCAPLLHIDFPKRLNDRNLLALYTDIELPLVDILIRMQRNGAKLDLAALDAVGEELSAEIREVERQIYEHAGFVFNINSPKALGELLFRKLGIETRTFTKIGPSTNEEVLQKIYHVHPIVPLILRYRKVFKLYSTYIQGYRAQMDANDFVHSAFNNTATVTGRLSSSEPNLQNIPARSGDAAKVRAIFTSRFAGGSLLCADYSQIELRILAHLSGDELMITAFSENRDIHNETAVKIFDIAPAAVTDTQRRIAKAVNFGIVYGMSAFGLAQSIDTTPAKASKFINKYFEQFPKIKTFLDGCRNYALENGYVKTIMGRRRYIKELTSSNPNLVQFANRAAMNMPMQGSAADIMKRAMIDVSAAMDAAGIKSMMIMQIHDELVFDVLPHEIEALTAILKDKMENVIKLKVPLEVDIEVKGTL